MDIRERLHNRCVLLVDIHQAERLIIQAANGCNAELEGLGLGIDILGLDRQGLEDWQGDGVDVGAGAGDHEALVQG